MARFRVVLGLVGGVLLVLSSAAHSLLGGKALRAELAAAHVPPDLAFTVMVGWHFGGAAMLAFGVIVVQAFLRHLGPGGPPLFPALVIGVVYLAFGVGALVLSGFAPFFSLFVGTGLLVIAGAVGGDPPARG